ncbi:MAG: sulfur oxidation c-type cytochrome SoxX [Pseudomonadota bacterium]
MATGLSATAAVVIMAGCGGAGLAPERDLAALSPEELAEHIIFESDSYRLDQEVPEGGVALQRMVQDEIQALCSLKGEPDAGTAGQVVAAARNVYQSPEGGPRLGDWRRGAELARSGYGYRVGHRPDDHSQHEPGANCYACHRLDPAEDNYGTLGPSLMHFGRTHGTGPVALDYTHRVISDPHQFFPCTHMPRFGGNRFLSEEQIRHVMAYLLDPESPVNR